MQQYFGRDQFTLIIRVAQRIHRRLPKQAELGDLLNDGYLGWAAAVDHFDHSRGTSFRFYAVRCIRGAIMEGLRQRDPLPRHIRHGARVPWIIHLIDSPDLNTDFREIGMIENQVDQILIGISDRPWLVLQLYYFEQIPMKRIAQRFGITEAAVSLICSRTLQRIRKEMQTAAQKTTQPRCGGQRG